MSQPSSLRAVGLRLEKAVALLPGESAEPADQFERYEQVAIAILDSEHMDFAPGLLEEYLMNVLYLKQLELGLLPEFQE